MSIGIIIFGLTMALSLYAMARVKSTFNRYNGMAVASGYTGYQAASRILRAAGIDDVEIIEHSSMLGDHYDPIHKRLVLSSDVYHGSSPAALGVAAHECGHAIQHKIAYAPLQWRMAAVGATTFASQVVLWLPILGLATGLLTNVTLMLWIMVVCWGIIMLFNLVTLPVEFDASRRAKLILNKMQFIRAGEEAIGVERVLNAAALTYVAAFITSLLYFLWYLLPLLMRRD
jgi:Zn-dependent membrane protease YugP